MKDFTYCAPTQVIFGRDTEKNIGKILKERGAKKVLM